MTVEFQNFENDTMRILVNEAKLTSLWARKRATIQQVLIFNFAGPEKLTGLWIIGALEALEAMNKFNFHLIIGKMD